MNSSALFLSPLIGGTYCSQTPLPADSQNPIREHKINTIGSIKVIKIEAMVTINFLLEVEMLKEGPWIYL